MNCFSPNPLDVHIRSMPLKNPVQNYIFSAFRVIIGLFFSYYLNDGNKNSRCGNLG